MTYTNRLDIKMNRRTQIITLLCGIILIVIILGSIILFAHTSTWLYAKNTGYNLGNPPPAEKPVIRVNETDFLLYPSLKVLLDNPNTEIPVSDDYLVALKSSLPVIPTIEAEEIYTKYGFMSQQYILYNNRYYEIGRLMV